MTVVKINAIEVPEGAGEELEARFASRAGAVEGQPGFRRFELLRPTEGESRYFVVTWWDDEESFQAWLSSRDFAAGHAQASAQGGPGEQARPPVSTGSSLLSFEVVEATGPRR